MRERKHPERAAIRRRRVLRWIIARLNERLADAHQLDRNNVHERRNQMIARAEELAEMALQFVDEVER